MEEVKRPSITDHLGKETTLEEAHNIYVGSPKLWSFIQAQDKYIDYLEQTEVNKLALGDVSKSHTITDIQTQ